MMVFQLLILFLVVSIQLVFGQSYEISFYPKSDKYALLIGINQYQSNRFNKLNAEQDVEKFTKWLKEYLNFDENNIITLTGKDATYENIRSKVFILKDVLVTLADKTARKPLFIIYFSGHGTKVTGTYYSFSIKEQSHSLLIPYDAVDYPKPNGIASNDRYITDENIVNWLQPVQFSGSQNYINYADIVFIFDACYQGIEEGTKAPIVPVSIASSIYSIVADAVVTASGASPTREEVGGGVFTQKFGEVISNIPTKGTYKLKDIFDNVKLQIKNKMSYLDENQLPTLEIPRKSDITLTNWSIAGLEVNTDKKAAIKIFGEDKEPITVVESGVRLIREFPVDKKIRVEVSRQEKEQKERGTIERNYFCDSGFFVLKPEEYKTIKIKLDEYLKPGFIKVVAIDEKGEYLKLVDEKEEFTGVSIAGIPKSAYRIIEKQNNIYEISINPNIYQEITAEKEEYKLKTVFDNQNIIVNSGSSKEIKFYLRSDTDYWQNKINNLNALPEKDAETLYKLSYAYFKKAEQTKELNTYQNSYNCIFDARSRDRNSQKYIQQALLVTKKLYEITENQKYKDDIEHFQGLFKKQ